MRFLTQLFCRHSSVVYVAHPVKHYECIACLKQWPHMLSIEREREKAEKAEKAERK